MNAVLETAEKLVGPYQEHNSNHNYLLVSVKSQLLYRIEDKRIADSYKISTALNGTGCEEGSGKTPLGVHRIAEKVGKDAEYGALFKARINTGLTAKILNNKNQYSDQDAITSRILWLDGLEVGKNKGGNVDTYRRYIYIHGTDEEWRLGQPVSHGCIRMANHAVIELYDKVSVNTLVAILE